MVFIKMLFNIPDIGHPNLFYSWYFFLMQFIFTKINKKKLLLWFFGKKKRYVPRLRFSTWIFRKKKIKIRFLTRRKYNNRRVLLSQKSLLFVKRRFGLLKYRYNPKAYELYRMNHFINLRRRKNKKRFFFLKSLKKKHVNKLFFKKVRQHLLTRLYPTVTKQKRKTRLLYSFFKKKNTNYFDITFVQLFLAFKIFLSYSDAVFYITKTGLYKNNEFISKPFGIIRLNDVVILNTTILHYSYMIYGLRKLKKYLWRIKPRIFKMMRNKIDINKEATKLFPKWTLKFLFYKNTKFEHIECEYTTLVFICFKMPKNYPFYGGNYNIMWTYYLYKLYNWKYIT